MSFPATIHEFGNAGVGYRALRQPPDVRPAIRGVDRQAFTRAAGAIIAVLFLSLRITSWLDRRLGGRVWSGYFFASALAVMAGLGAACLPAYRTALLEDLLLLGVALTMYKFGWRPALFLSLAAELVIAWAITRWAVWDWYPLLSSAVSSVVLMWIIGRTGRMQRRAAVRLEAQSAGKVAVRSLIRPQEVTR